MYKAIIEINNNVNADVLIATKKIIESAFDNRLGQVKNSSLEPYCLIFSGDENKYGCLEVGLFALKKHTDVLKNIVSLKWIDKEPSESCDMLEVFSKNIN